MAEVRKDHGRIFLNVMINNHPVEMLLDSGAHSAVINNRIWRAMGKPELLETNASFISCTKTSWFPLILHLDLNKLIYDGVIYHLETRESSFIRRKELDMQGAIWSKPFVCDVECEGTTIEMEIDIGSHVSIIGKRLWRKLGRPALEPLTGPVHCTANQEIPMKGKMRATVRYKDKKISNLSLLVQENDESPLLGVDWLEAGLRLDFNEIFVHLESC
ncbi:hypothetical protein GHT06_022061 [Daphnia sinensis]|uniref:Peptidase A2 domain-containing protein n=1 Tax=Daphnia sinensis TaxID=1820382 RepID=A0AAD5KH07_9CRUS|nr:hypothetical protein GHT06_022061 [Daphnia sinensis]